MSVFDLLRRFFYPPGTRDPFFGGMTYDDEDDEDDEGDDDFFFAQQSPSHHHRPPFHDPFGFEDLFRDFNELFADFGSKIPDVSSLPRIEPPTRSPGQSGTGSLRDFMLKYPDSHLPTDPTTPPRGPSSSQGPDVPKWTPRWEADAGDTKQDKILDSEVSSHGLDSILSPAAPASPLQPPSSSSSSTYFRSVAVSRVMRPDGTVEERRTVNDSDGNTNTTVTVTRGDQLISSGTTDPSSDKDMGLIPHRSLPDLSDSQTILSRILHRWFSS